MKKLVAIALLGALLFNMGGVAVFFQYFIHQSDIQIVKEMYDNRFDSNKLVEIKVPVNMPTVQDQSDYQNVQGQIQYNGSYYNYVRLKMTKDTMSFLCLPNTVKNHLVSARTVAVKNIADIPSTKKGHETSSKKADFGYDNVCYIAQCNYLRFAKQLNPITSTAFAQLTSPYIQSPGKPPNAIS